MMAKQHVTTKPKVRKDKFLKEYIIESHIGQGAFATVFRAHHKITKLSYAVKVIKSDQIVGAQADLIETEIRLLRKMKHPNITELIEIERHPNNICLVMEYCSLGDLSVYLKKNRSNPVIGGPAGGLSEALYRSFLIQLASAFKFLRSKNIIHRDLKPQNILLSPSKKTASEEAMKFQYFSDNLPQLKVADFGLAKILPAQSLTTTSCGSPLYMAPEIHCREPYDAKVDLWSIGAVVYEIVVGRRPFPASSIWELLDMIKKGQDYLWFPTDSDSNLLENNPDPSKNGNGIPLVSNDIQDLLLGLLKQNPSDRITFEEFFAHPATQKIYPFDTNRGKLFLTKAEVQERNIKAIEKHFKMVTSFKETISTAQLDPPRERSRSATVIPTPEGASKDPILKEIDFEKDCIIVEHELRDLQFTTKEKEKVNSTLPPITIKNYALPPISIPIPNSTLPTITIENCTLPPITINIPNSALPPIPIPNSTPLSIQSPASTPCRDKPKPKPTNQRFSVLPLPKTFPKSLLLSLEDCGSDDTLDGANTAPCFRKTNQDNKSETSSNYSGWGVGTGAVAIASALSRASLRFFGKQGLSPPASEFCTSGSEATSFPLAGPVTSAEEESVLLETEQVACQAYALTKFANVKLDKLKNRTMLFSDPVISDIPVVAYHWLGINCQETFLLYIKALSLLYIGFDKISSYWSKFSITDSKAVASSRLSRASRWLQSKTNECLEKAELLQSRMLDLDLKVESYSTDKLIYDYAIKMCQNGVFKEFREEEILESESDYLMGLWMLQAILYRTPQDSKLSDETDVDIRQMLSTVEQRIIGFRKMLEELNLKNYALNPQYLLSNPKS